MSDCEKAFEEWGLTKEGADCQNKIIVSCTERKHPKTKETMVNLTKFLEEVEKVYRAGWDARRDKSLRERSELLFEQNERVIKAYEKVAKLRGILYKIGCADLIKLNDGSYSGKVWTPEQCALMRLFEEAIDEAFGSSSRNCLPVLSLEIGEKAVITLTDGVVWKTLRVVSTQDDELFKGVFCRDRSNHPVNIRFEGSPHEVDSLGIMERKLSGVAPEPQPSVPKDANREETWCPEGYDETEQEAPIDKELLPLLKALNEAGLKTSQCCSGHGNKPAYVSINMACLEDVAIRDNGRRLVLWWKLKKAEETQDKKLRAEYVIGKKLEPERIVEEKEED